MCLVLSKGTKLNIFKDVLIIPKSVISCNFKYRKKKSDVLPSESSSVICRPAAERRKSSLSDVWGSATYQRQRGNNMVS